MIKFKGTRIKGFLAKASSKESEPEITLFAVSMVSTALYFQSRQGLLKFSSLKSLHKAFQTLSGNYYLEYKGRTRFLPSQCPFECLQIFNSVSDSYLALSSFMEIT